MRFRIKEPLKHQGQTLESKCVGALPIINHFLDRLRLEPLFEQVMPCRDPRSKLSPAIALGVFVRHLLVARYPLYELPEWAETFVPEMLGLTSKDSDLLNDDRIGRCLDLLFEADRAKLLTSFILQMIEEFHLKLEALHNDSTSVSFTGSYRPRRKRSGTQPRLITYGHNKDHRPGLKQLLFELTVTEDGAVPVLVGIHDGNVTDDQTHLSTWKKLRQIVGSSNFIYVADSKLCVTETLTYITGQGGHFVTVLPATRKEEGWFKAWIQNNVVPWEAVWRRPPLRRRTDPPDIFRGFESPLPSAEGYRIIWYHSSIKHELEQGARQTRIRRAVAELEFLKTRTGARRLKTKEQVEQAAEKIIQQMGAERWIEVTVELGEVEYFRQANPGRPGKETGYRRLSRSIPKVSWRLLEERIAWEAKIDGLFPLMTDMRNASLKQVLLWYKYQPRLEKRFEQLKTVMRVRPVCLKNVERVEAFLLLYYMALTAESLLERELREAMKKQRIERLPIYPEKRLCRAPTAERVLDLFANLRRHRLLEGGREMNRFYDDLTPIQRQVLKLLGVEAKSYTK